MRAGVAVLVPGLGRVRFGHAWYSPLCLERPKVPGLGRVRVGHAERQRSRHESRNALLHNGLTGVEPDDPKNLSKS